MMHDLLPWDDDVDIMVAARYRKLVEDILSSLQPEYDTVSHQAYMKIFFSRTPADLLVRWSWPFVDISFYERNSSHVWETNHQHVPERCYPIEMVFPVHRRPFGGLWIPSPETQGRFWLDPFTTGASGSDVAGRVGSIGTRQILARS